MVMKLLSIATLAGSLMITTPVISGPAEDNGELLNAYRAQKGRSPLEYSAKLAKAAQKHAEYMSKTNTLTHKGRGGSSVRKRVTAQGFKGCYWAENVAQGQTSAAEAHESWQTSSGHNKNMLARKPTHYGVGYASGDYWVQVFAKAC